MNGLRHATAFVIQFRDATQSGADHLSGRIEHVATGRTATFQSVEELPQLLREMLRSASTAEQRTDEFPPGKAS